MENGNVVNGTSEMSDVASEVSRLASVANGVNAVNSAITDKFGNVKSAKKKSAKKDTTDKAPTRKRESFEAVKLSLLSTIDNSDNCRKVIHSLKTMSKDLGVDVSSDLDQLERHELPLYEQRRAIKSLFAKLAQSEQLAENLNMVQNICNAWSNDETFQISVKIKELRLSVVNLRSQGIDVARGEIALSITDKSDERLTEERKLKFNEYRRSVKAEVESFVAMTFPNIAIEKHLFNTCVNVDNSPKEYMQFGLGIVKNDVSGKSAHYIYRANNTCCVHERKLERDTVRPFLIGKVDKELQKLAVDDIIGESVVS